jgi:hypothetical protein
MHFLGRTSDKEKEKETSKRKDNAETQRSLRNAEEEGTGNAGERKEWAFDRRSPPFVKQGWGTRKYMGLWR